MCPVGATVTLHYYNGTFLSMINPVDGSLGGSGLIKSAGPDTYYIGTADGSSVHQQIVIQVVALDGSIAWYGTRGINGPTTNEDDFVPIEIKRGGAGSANFLNAMQWAYVGSTRNQNDALGFGLTGIQAGSRATITGMNSDTATGVKDAVNPLMLDIGDDNPNYTNAASANLVIDNTDGSDAITKTIDFNSLIQSAPIVGNPFCSLVKNVGNNQFSFQYFTTGVGHLHAVIQDTSTMTSMHRFLETDPTTMSELLDKETLGSGFNVTSENTARKYRISAYNHALVEFYGSVNSFDGTPPTTGTIIVDAGSGFTSSFTGVTLTLSATDDAAGAGIKDMMISNLFDFSDNPPRQPYTSTVTGWNLTPVAEGAATTVYVRFFDFNNNVKDASYSVIYDQTPPTETSPLSVLGTIYLGDNKTSFGSLMLGIQDALAGMQNGSATLLIRPQGAPDWLTAQRIPMTYAGGSLLAGNTSMWGVEIGPNADGAIQPVVLTNTTYEYCAEMRDGAGVVGLSPVNTVNVLVQKATTFEETTIPSSFNPGNDETTEIRGIIGEGDAKPIEIVIYNESGQVVREMEITDPVKLLSGYQTYTWDGRGSNGKTVSPGEYTIRVTVRNASTGMGTSATIRTQVVAGNGCIGF
jgi:hypothetical protein